MQPAHRWAYIGLVGPRGSHKPGGFFYLNVLFLCILKLWSSDVLYTGLDGRHSHLRGFQVKLYRNEGKWTERIGCENCRGGYIGHESQTVGLYISRDLNHIRIIIFLSRLET